MQQSPKRPFEKKGKIQVVTTFKNKEQAIQIGLAEGNTIIEYVDATDPLSFGNHLISLNADK